MLTLRPSKARGFANHGWLRSYFTFSFAHYVDRAHMGFGPIRVINEDTISKGGFDMHPHDNMEIITYIINGNLDHKDSMGHASTITKAMVQKMSAGTGIMHSEFNLSDELTHLLQIWIYPHTKNLKPYYEELNYNEEKNVLTCIASDSCENSVTLYQHLDLFRSECDKGVTIQKVLVGNKAWIQLISGVLLVNGTSLEAGDGLAIEDESRLDIQAVEAAHFLLFDIK